jgi:hypothetical protein
VRIIGLGFFAVVAFNGVDDVALVFLAKESLGGGDSGAGVLYAAVGVGLVIGYALCWPGTPDASRWSFCSCWD